MGQSAPPNAHGRRRTRSMTADMENQKQPETVAGTDQAAGTSKKPKLSEEAELLQEAIYALSEESNKDAAQQLPVSSEVLVAIPNAKVNLIGEEGHVVNLASGELVMVKIVQNGSAMAVFARIGDDLQWPLAKDMPALKLKEGHYVFSLRVPVSLEDALEDADSVDLDQEASSTDVLNYELSFHGDVNHEQLKELDKVLERYSSFLPVPDLKEEVMERIEKAEQGGNPPKKGDYYLNHLAPNVEDYHSALARSIASGSGQLVKGILWVSDMMAQQIEKSGLFMQKHIKPRKAGPAKVSPKTMKGIQSAKKVTKKTEELANGLLSGVVTATGSITSSVLKSGPGAKIFGMLPGEAALATLNAFVRVFDALELASKNVMSKTSLVTCQVVSHRYGDEAAALTKEGLSTAGHLVTTAWTVSKIRTAINPKSAPRNPGLIKAAAAAAVEELKGKKHK